MCCQGDTIDDLCRPEYDDELEELKQLCEVRHPHPPSIPTFTHTLCHCLSPCRVPLGIVAMPCTTRDRLFSTRAVEKT